MPLVSADGQSVDQKAVALQVVDSNTIGLAGAAIYGQSAPDVFTPVGVSGGGALAVAMGAVPTGGATSALQTTGNTSLASLVTNTTGVATAAKQDTGNTSLAAIAASLASMDTKLNNLTPGAAAVFPIAAGAAGPTVIKASGGRLVSVLVSTVGAGVMIFYDNASAASGTIIGVIPASAPVGTPVVFNFPAVNGITALGGVTMPAVSVAYL